MRAFTMAGLIALTLSACSGRGPEPIRDFGVASVSEFERGIVTQRELSFPPSFATLPPPNPGGPNRADP